MPVNLSIKNVPDEVARGLRNRAARNQRSFHAGTAGDTEAGGQGPGPGDDRGPAGGRQSGRSLPWTRRPPKSSPPTTRSRKKSPGASRTFWVDPTDEYPGARD